MSLKSNTPQLPIIQIGEKDWIQNLTVFLGNYDVEVFSLANKNLILTVEKYLNWTIPESIKQYLLAFGGIESSDFMYNFKKVNEWEILAHSEWEYIAQNFSQEEANNYIVFSESPATDPICFNKDNDEIYLFSHDPIKKAKVYKNFNDYLLNEIIEIQKLYAEFDFIDDKSELIYKENLLNGENIDYEFRFLKL